eukprot:364474-Chlamydomonas_euryale.AAC.5
MDGPRAVGGPCCTLAGTTRGESAPQWSNGAENCSTEEIRKLQRPEASASVGKTQTIHQLGSTFAQLPTQPKEAARPGVTGGERARARRNGIAGADGDGGRGEGTRHVE